MWDAIEERLLTACEDEGDVAQTVPGFKVLSIDESDTTTEVRSVYQSPIHHTHQQQEWNPSSVSPTELALQPMRLHNESVGTTASTAVSELLEGELLRYMDANIAILRRVLPNCVIAHLKANDVHYRFLSSAALPTKGSVLSRSVTVYVVLHTMGLLLIPPKLYDELHRSVEKYSTFRDTFVDRRTGHYTGVDAGAEMAVLCSVRSAVEAISGEFTAAGGNVLSVQDLLPPNTLACEVAQENGTVVTLTVTREVFTKCQRCVWASTKYTLSRTVRSGDDYVDLSLQFPDSGSARAFVWELCQFLDYRKKFVSKRSSAG
uniref:Catalase-peroxidase n=1 Tax=Lygus hesperus TaxID=30085 RepID=A0A0A9YK39_LYGHE